MGHLNLSSCISVFPSSNYHGNPRINQYNASDLTVSDEGLSAILGSFLSLSTQSKCHHRNHSFTTLRTQCLTWQAWEDDQLFTFSPALSSWHSYYGNTHDIDCHILVLPSLFLYSSPATYV